MLLVVVLKLTTLHIALIIIPNKLATLLILVLPATIWMKPLAFPVNKAFVRERGTGVTLQSDLEGILNLEAFSCQYASMLTNP